MQGPLPLRWEEAALHSPQGPQSARDFGQRPENRSNCVLQDGRERSVQAFCLRAGEKRWVPLCLGECQYPANPLNVLAKTEHGN
jgi:hypothetical protein